MTGFQSSPEGRGGRGGRGQKGLSRPLADSDAEGRKIAMVATCLTLFQPPQKLGG